MGEDEVNLGADKENLAAGVGASEDERFEPTEDELVLHFLRPQLRGFAPRVAGAVVEADPCAAAPWELLARHGLRERGQGYFFAARRRGRHLVRRSLEGGGGSWMHSSTKDEGRSVTELGVVVRWCRTRYCFYVRSGEELGGQMRSTGWVMAEYEITDPRCYRRADDGEEDEYWVLCHVRKSVRSRRDVSSPKGSRTRRR